MLSMEANPSGIESNKKNKLNTLDFFPMEFTLYSFLLRDDIQANNGKFEERKTGKNSKVNF